MAVLATPTGINFGTATKPDNVLIIVPAANIMPGGPPAVFTRPVLGTPAIDQLVNSSGGYAV